MKFVKCSDGEIYIRLENVHKKSHALTRIEWGLYHDLIKSGKRDKANKLKKRWTYEWNENEEVWKVAYIGKDGGYDGYLEKTFIPHRISDDEWKAFKDEFWLTWYNPYEDGRDCTGVKFSSWMSKYYVTNGTWIYHGVSYDV